MGDKDGQEWVKWSFVFCSKGKGQRFAVVAFLKILKDDDFRGRIGIFVKFRALCSRLSLRMPQNSESRKKRKFESKKRGCRREKVLVKRRWVVLSKKR